MTEHIILSENMQNEIGNFLEHFIEETNAHHVVFATKSGGVLDHRGFNFGEKIFSLTALVTGIFNATRELAKLIDEKNFEQFYIRGEDWRLFYQDVTPLFILVVFFKEPTLLGTVRLFGEKFVDKINSIFKQPKVVRIERREKEGEDKLEESTLDRLFEK